jgi:hypothetical protein
MSHKICEHAKRKEYCIPCGGSAMCVHNKRKSRCKECGGQSLCNEHGRERSQCVPCGGSGICEHKIRKSYCIPCAGSSICEHNKRKHQCLDCKGSSYCEHKKRRSGCKDCKGTEICEHYINKRYCTECDGSIFCEHGKNKYRCKNCNGSGLCKSWWCEVRAIRKYKGYCLSCCIQVCPEIEVVNNYKTKEKETVDRIKETFPNFTWVHDKKIKDGCSKRRPDLLVDLGSHIIIIEVDENKHTDYDCSCEHKRLMEISQDLHFRPIIFIRFNPDSYIFNGIKIKSCWGINGNGIIVIKNKKEWIERINVLKEQISYWINNETDKTIEIIELFY